MELRIDNWHNEITVAHSHPDPLRVRDYIEKLTRHSLFALEQALAGYLQKRDGEIILVRSLDLAMDLDTSCDIEQASRALARKVACGLVETIEPTAPTVVKFSSEAAYRARFIEDLASGRAWGQWYYASFEGLSALPTSCAIRSVLLDEPDIGRAALAAVPFESWAGLDDADAIRIINGLVDHTTECDGAALLEELPQLAARFAGNTAFTAPVLALALLTQLGKAGLSLTPTAILAAEVVANQLAPRGGPVVELQCIPRHLRIATQAAMRELAQQVRAIPAVQAPDTLESHLSPFAGLAVLLDDLDRLLIDEGPRKGVLALAILACLAGKGRREALWRDTAWRVIFSVDTSEAPPLSKRFIAGSSRALLRKFACRVPGMADASPAYLRANFLLASGRCERLSANHYRMRIARPPLHVLLALTGISRGSRVWHTEGELVQIDLEYL